MNVLYIDQSATLLQNPVDKTSISSDPSPLFTNQNQNIRSIVNGPDKQNNKHTQVNVLLLDLNLFYCS
jgi:hypothetical protein